ncbi:YihY/virulence factor BrkB family protein [Microbacterium sp. QXD-8]|uniref:YihY/virulence factor BrkB family protein n=1 Tax=Microbacterium psychrotolerans TaxID=3068321 RepID=A0ABU0Z2L3_9MICO|nr:YihY/virulence factor BrkB family protein [Microbacterium sp. QXD-8]MDQ7878833.1 YihY/virulence factor BrkB family protein [Microbacterium sp. QXD-8]
MTTTDHQRDGRGAPDAEHPDKPDTPAEIEKRSWKYVFVKTAREFSSDECTDIAAALTYYSVLAIFPGLVAVFSIFGLIAGNGGATDAILGVVESAAPETARTLRGPLEQLADSPAAGWGLVLGLLLAIWSASGYVGAFGRAMNRIYEIEEGRPFWKLKPAQLLVTVIGVALIVVALVILVVSGPVADAVGSALGLGEVATTVWEIAKWPVLAAIVVLMVAILYYATPNAKQPKFRWISLGSLLAILVLVVASVAFGLYVANFSNYDRTYGSLAGVIVFLLWLWIANIALLFGAEFDAELERGRQLQAGIAAEEDIQLPPRDTRKSDKAAEKERHDVEEGRRIREEHDDDDADATSDKTSSRRQG